MITFTPSSNTSVLLRVDSYYHYNNNAPTHSLSHTDILHTVQQLRGSFTIKKLMKVVHLKKVVIAVHELAVEFKAHYAIV